MKPAFHAELPLGSDRKTIDVGGPYELQGGETSAYFWFRISQKPKRAGAEIDVVGTHEREKDELESDLDQVRDALRERLAAAVSASLPAAGSAVTPARLDQAAKKAYDAALAAPGPEWSTTVTAEQKFEVGPATAEGWLLMKTTKDKAGSTLFWTSKVKLVAKDA
jgi:hypothetical protein